VNRAITDEKNTFRNFNDPVGKLLELSPSTIDA